MPVIAFFSRVRFGMLTWCARRVVSFVQSVSLFGWSTVLLIVTGDTQRAVVGLALFGDAFQKRPFTLDRQSMLGGALFGVGSATTGHLRVGRGATVYGRSTVTKDIPPGASVAGFPAEDVKQWRRGVANLRRLSNRDEA